MSTRRRLSRIKGALQNRVVALGFEPVSFFQRLLIATLHNRYGWSQRGVVGDAADRVRGDAG
jgi:hypothetical protein